MIPRRIYDHVKTHNWFAVGVDLAIVVLGVFLGTQVSNWNEERETRARGEVFSARLKDDLLFEAWGFQYIFEYNDDVLKSAETAMDALEGRAALDDEALLVAAYRATQYREPRRRRSTYDELISTGGIGLIRDRAFRSLAIRVYTTPIFDNIRREGVDSRYRELFRMAVPTAIQRALSRSCGDRDVVIGDYASIVDQLDYPCKTGLPPAALRDAAAALRANPLTVPLLRLRIANLDSRRGDMLSLVNGDIREALKKLRESGS